MVADGAKRLELAMVKPNAADFRVRSETTRIFVKIQLWTPRHVTYFISGFGEIVILLFEYVIAWYISSVRTGP